MPVRFPAGRLRLSTNPQPAAQRRIGRIRPQRTKAVWQQSPIPLNITRFADARQPFGFAVGTGGDGGRRIGVAPVPHGAEIWPQLISSGDKMIAPTALLRMVRY